MKLRKLGKARYRATSPGTSVSQDSAGDIVVGAQARRYELGDMFMYIFFGLFVVVVYVVIMKTVGVISNSNNASTSENLLAMGAGGGDGSGGASGDAGLAKLVSAPGSSVNYVPGTVNRNRGPEKVVVVPQRWTANGMERDATFHLGNRVVVHWSEIPVSASRVTISLRMSNPPLVDAAGGGGDSSKDFSHVVIATSPFAGGLVISMPDKEHYRVDIGSARRLMFRRNPEYWDPKHEVFEVSFTQDAGDRALVESNYNGFSEVLETRIGGASVPVLRSLPMNVEIRDPFKLENFWVSYGN
jgi:hypothetical protein